MLKKKSCITVGYNDDKQRFFDLLLAYKPYINSYFFHTLHGMEYHDKYPENHILNELYSCDTYNIPGNILFNYKRDEENKEIIYKTLDKIFADNKINLKQITLATPEMGMYIKQKYPQLETHLSVHYSITYELNKLGDGIDCVNLSSVYDFNSFDKIKLLKDKGIKVKYIIDKGCLPNREKNYKQFKESSGMTCELCGQCCHKLFDVYPWLKLSKVFYFIEARDLFFNDVDIWKIPSRGFNPMPTDMIGRLLKYFVLSDRTTNIDDLYIDNYYDEYLKWLKKRFNCDNMCSNGCTICKDFYNLIKEK